MKARTAGKPGARVLRALVSGDCDEAFELLGPHTVGRRGDASVVRVFRPGASAVSALVDGDIDVPLERIHSDGVFQGKLPRSSGEASVTYRLRISGPDGSSRVVEDPYRFSPVLDERRLGAFVDQGDSRLYETLGARLVRHEGVPGTCFAVWAPNARAVNLMGEFNDWDARSLPMCRRHSGVWELFVPDVGQGSLYKYEVRPRSVRRSLFRAHKGRDDGLSIWTDKADPLGFAAELRPASASMVWDLERYEWGDSEWMAERPARHEPHTALSIYEVHLGSWRRRPGAPDGDPAGWPNYRELADSLLPYVRQMGFTHVELLPVTEHPLDASWGYQTVALFAPTSRHGTPDDFRYFVDRAHQLEIGVILDWVPAHFPRDPHGLALFDGTHLYDHEDPRRGAHPEWGTQIYDFGRTEVRSFLESSALFWLDRYHIDGLRVDAVASMLYLDYARAEGEWVPNEFGGRENLDAVAFIRGLNETIHEAFPDVLVFAEESTAWPKVTHPPRDGGLGFDMKWKMGWMNDTLSVMQNKPEKRAKLHDTLTFSIMYAFQERFLLPLSHDEVVHMKRSLLEKMPGTDAAKFANLRLLFAYMWAHPGRKLLFMGGEFGQRTEWNHDTSLPWELLELPRHEGVQKLVRELNHLYSTLPALHELTLEPEGFEWIDSSDRKRSVLTFQRRARDWRDFVVVAANFSARRWRDYVLGVPFEGEYQVILDTNDPRFGGEGPRAADDEVLVTSPSESHGRECSLRLHLPPLSALYLKREPTAD